MFCRGMGRGNSVRRLASAYALGCDSVGSTTYCPYPCKLDRHIAALRRIDGAAREQPSLFREDRSSTPLDRSSLQRLA